MSGSDWVEIVKVVASLFSAIFMPVIAIWIRRLEKNTNSIKDALVASTAREHEAIGKEKERQAQAVRETQPKGDI